ncbi:osmotically inducible protein OsmC [Streptomyces sp. SAI-135]|uniref:organic hydroperoxide resistance protein n=1 Tax=unclassified Streptomyces TaxID=2593676 RepID=UPI00247346B9|nr:MULTISPECIES: organic hydroperoxide resistance protein [unclassified Streptomyces]MDH6523004.1 osmotically inducible protein OsmC [Streptomyces sp. SAI-090]MDH6573887.1 osmotically inducible protein OsmC [Streptomyces sp. SAI-117]MDH6581377.1 osmotically inducible protein OsmC [Streptomyces sp. SAI-133]MDH6613383.1 osmotically inducible protein OsmC [Streptomyces sp. SAI-135]
MTDIVYAGVATSTSEGRAGGRVQTDDGLLDLTLAVPKEMGGPGGATNPEQLFAAGWSACFHSALKAVAAQQKVELASSTVIAEVSVEKTPEGGFGLSATLHIDLAGVEQAVADQLSEAAHAICPYSNATRGNVPVELDVTVA